MNAFSHRDPSVPPRQSSSLRLHFWRLALGLILLILRIDVMLALPHGRRHRFLLRLADSLLQRLRGKG